MPQAAFRAYTDAEITTAISNWKAAFDSIRVGKSYTIAGRTVTRADEQFILNTLGSFQEEKERRAGIIPPRCSYANHAGGVN